MERDVLPGDLDRVFPICTPGACDTARFDEALELLNLAGRPLHHAMLMMIPEAWENHERWTPRRKAFYRYHSALIEPWDGPASIAFTDGTVIGAVLDRNGLRPRRYWVTDDDRVIMAREVGVLDVAARARSCARAGSSRARCSSSTPRRAASSPTRRSRPSSPASTRTRSGSTAGSCTSTICPPQFPLVPQHSSAVQQQRMFGYTQEDLRLIIAPMARNAVESLGSMGTDTPVRGAVRPAPHALRLLQAAVRAGHEPAARRELRGAGHVAQLVDRARGQPARARRPSSCHQIVCASPILTTRSWRSSATSTTATRAVPGFKPFTVYCNYPVAEGGEGLREGDRQRPRAGQRGDRRRREHRDPLRPLRRRRERADPGAAA